MKKCIEADELKELLMDARMSVPEFAVTEAELHPQTVYKALSGKPVGMKSLRKLAGATARLKQRSRAVS